MLMSQVKERSSLSCGSGRVKREVAFELILILWRALEKRLGKGCISDKRTSIGKSMELQDGFRLDSTLGV